MTSVKSFAGLRCCRRPEELPACCCDKVGGAVCSGGSTLLGSLEQGGSRASFGGVIGIAQLSSEGNGCIGGSFKGSWMW
ncbi:369_t:CDS:2 [Gigaspora margarita]|uniref:369_t:CDS:1 n=1 Tax=Gigaspora margarita TaxID=4874 RepID=A0ABN7W954_GIGMA|nr:369_t:CDS:2 [Gigaspora margarita]